MWTVIISLLHYLVFPGLMFTVAVALLVSGLDRKITARIQSRQGPPITQGFYDFFKLLGKEIVIPNTAQKETFVFMPVIAFFVTVLIGMILWKYVLIHKTFGDWIILLYFLTVPVILLMLGSAASGNVIASLGVSREMKLLLSYELPLVTATLVPIIKTSSIKISEIMSSSVQPVGLTFSGIIAVVVVILCLQAKSGLVPFDIPEAETELASGVVIEYSGILLGLIKLTRQIIFSLSPLIIIILFFPGGNIIIFLIKYLLVLLIFNLLRNTNPRLKINQAIKFFWFIIFPLSFVAVVLALLGL